MQDRWLWVFATLSFLAGLVMLFSGLRPRRRGSAPYCRRCGYNLTGLTADRCPECGREIKPGGVVLGKRRRRPARISIGALCLVAATAGCVHGLRRIDWLQNKPAWLLLHDVQNPDAVAAGKALKELQRRYRANKLWHSQKRRLVRLCLEQQVRKSLAIRHGEFTSFLQEIYRKGDIDPADGRQFLDQLLVARLRVRPRVAVTDPVPAVFDLDYNMPSWMPGKDNFWAEITGGEYALDGQVIGDWKNRRDKARSFGISARHIRFATPGVGTHDLSAWVHVKYYWGERRVVYETELHATASFEILSQEPPDYIRFVKDANLQQAVHTNLRPQEFRVECDATRTDVCWLRGKIWSHRPGANLAFDVYARIKGQEYRIDWMLHSKESGLGYRPISARIEFPESDTLDLILRPSRDVAKKSVHDVEFLDAVLIYPGIPVARQ